MLTPKPCYSFLPRLSPLFPKQFVSIFMTCVHMTLCICSVQDGQMRGSTPCWFFIDGPNPLTTETLIRCIPLQRENCTLLGKTSNVCNAPHFQQQGWHHSAAWCPAADHKAHCSSICFIQMRRVHLVGNLWTWCGLHTQRFCDEQTNNMRCSPRPKCNKTRGAAKWFSW